LGAHRRVGSTEIRIRVRPGTDRDAWLAAVPAHTASCRLLAPISVRSSAVSSPIRIGVGGRTAGSLARRQSIMCLSEGSAVKHRLVTVTSWKPQNRRNGLAGTVRRATRLSPSLGPPVSQPPRHR
jgi:hypothetical protein